MRILEHLEKLSELLGFLGALIVIPMVGAMVFEVFSRYVFNAPTIWSFEISYMMMSTIFAFGFAYALKYRQHVNVDFIYANLSARWRAAVDLVGFALFFPAICWITYALYNYALRAFRSGEVSGISAWNPVVWPMRVLLFIGFAVFAIQIAVEIARCLRTLAKGDEEERTT